MVEVKWFDVSDNFGDTSREDVLFLRNKLTEDFEDCMIRKSVAECLINAAVFGTGIGEIVIEEMKEMAPATQPIMDGDLQAVGVQLRSGQSKATPCPTSELLD